MAQYLSEDLRIRVIGAIEGGMSRNGAARRFGVSIASAVRWMDEYLRCGRTAPKPRGGDRRSGRIEAQADLLMRASEQEREDVRIRREAWFTLQPDLDPTRLVFLDETGATTKMSRLVGAPRAATAAARRCRMAIGKPRRWSRACASTA